MKSALYDMSSNGCIPSLQNLVSLRTAVVIIFISLFIWWLLPKIQIRGLKSEIIVPKDRAAIEDNFRKTIGQLLGAAGVIISLYFGFLQLKDQNQTATCQLKAAYAQINQEYLSANALDMNNQIDKGFDELGDSNDNDLITHTAGIYLLKYIMNRDSDYHESIVDALGAFVRSQTYNRDTIALRKNYSPPKIDVQMALTVLGQRGSGLGYVDLQGARIPWCYLNGLDFTQAYLGWADMDHAWLQGTHFRGATMNNVSLVNAKLQWAILRGVDLTGADLTGADLRGADLTGANLRSVDLRGADLRDSSPKYRTIVSQSQLDQACGDAKTQLPARYYQLRTCPGS